MGNTQSKMAMTEEQAAVEFGTCYNCECVLFPRIAIHCVQDAQGDDETWCDSCYQDCREQLEEEGYTLETDDEDDDVIPSCCSGVEGCSQCVDKEE